MCAATATASSFAQDAALAVYARRLGEVADQLADEDPLVAPARVVERLREVPPPPEVNLSDARLVRLASVVSQHAASPAGRNSTRVACRPPAPSGYRTGP